MTRTSPRGGRRGKPGGDVDRIADGGELDVGALPHRAEPGTGVDAGADRDPRTIRIGMAGRAQERAGRRDAALGVPLAGEQRKEHRHQLVADELVDRAVVIEDDARCGRVEPVQDRW